TYRFTVHPQDFRAAMKNPDIPTGEIVLAGNLRYQNQPDVPLMRTVYVDGRLNSRELVVRSTSLRTAIRNLAAQFRVANGNMEAHAIAADLLGGHLAANARMLHMDTQPVANIHAGLAGISQMQQGQRCRAANWNRFQSLEPSAEPRMRPGLEAFRICA